MIIHQYLQYDGYHSCNWYWASTFTRWFGSRFHAFAYRKQCFEYTHTHTRNYVLIQISANRVFANETSFNFIRSFYRKALHAMAPWSIYTLYHGISLLTAWSWCWVVMGYVHAVFNVRNIWQWVGWRSPPLLNFGHLFT